MRTLSTRNIDATNQALFLNGLLRFPRVLLYCLIGVGIAVFAKGNPEFIATLPSPRGEPEYNLAVPLYMINNLPVGLVGLSMVALFAAAMSSLDSVLNSLSATTMEDFVRRFHQGIEWSQRGELIYSRSITALWGVVTLIMAFYVGDIADTVLEAINQIGSLANGSILAVFALGLFTMRGHGAGAITGLLLGIGVNVLLWLFAPSVSWLWWNVIGFVVTFGTGWLLGSFAYSKMARVDYAADLNSETLERSVGHYLAQEAEVNWKFRSLLLLLWFSLMFGLLWLIGG